METEDRDRQQQLQLLQQLVELQRENIALRRNGSNDQPSKSHTKKPERPTIEPDSTDSDWAIFIDSWNRYKEMSGNAKTTCDALRNWFCTYGVPEEISTDGGPPFDSQEYNQFLDNWGIRKRTSSAYYPQSNGRAELAVKTAKRILADSTDSYGRLCHDRAARSLLTHRNTPIQDLNISPAMMLYGRVIKDHLPILQDKYQIHKRWREISRYRETAMAKGHIGAENQGVYSNSEPGQSISLPMGEN